MLRTGRTLWLDEVHMYIVTGGAGFIGSAMLWRLNQAGITDIMVVDNLGSTEKWKNLVNRRYARYVHRDSFLEMLRGDTLGCSVDAVLHMGACSSTTEKNADFLMANNTAYTTELCRFALNHGARFINASSASTYGDGSHGFADCAEVTRRLKPLNMYGYSKHLFDLWLLDNKLDCNVASLKFFNVYGPNEYHKGRMASVVLHAYKTIKETGKMELFRSHHHDYRDGEQSRDFVFVDDIADVMMYFMNTQKNRGIYNVGTGKARSFLDLTVSVFNSMNLSPDISFIETPIDLRGRYQYFTEAEIQKLRDVGYSKPFTSLEEGVGIYVGEFLKSGNCY